MRQLRQTLPLLCKLFSTVVCTAQKNVFCRITLRPNRRLFYRLPGFFSPEISGKSLVVLWYGFCLKLLVAPRSNSTTLRCYAFVDTATTEREKHCTCFLFHLLSIRIGAGMALAGRWIAD